jgi:hypothetical protein
MTHIERCITEPIGTPLSIGLRAADDGSMNPVWSPLIALVGGALVAVGARTFRTGARGVAVAVVIVGGLVAAYGLLGVLLLGL